MLITSRRVVMKPGSPGLLNTSLHSLRNAPSACAISSSCRFTSGTSFLASAIGTPAASSVAVERTANGLLNTRLTAMCKARASWLP